jgi:alpha-ketoglutarate-dependent 2,4-dichlorophenoxyacetate dioxygenase
MVEATALHPTLASEIRVDLRKPLTAATVAGIVSIMDYSPVGVFRHERPVGDAEHVAFSRRFGPVERMKTPPGGARVPFPEIIDQSNLDANGAIFADDDKRMLYKRANRLWHTDMSFHAVRATYSLLSAHVIPPDDGAPTEFADMRAAYDALPETTKAQIEPLVAEHDYYHSRVTGGGPEPSFAERSLRPPAKHPLVHVHPGSQRKALYLASHISRIVGLSDADSRSVIDKLMAFATQPEFVYSHVWRVGDVVMWDNLATMHRATPFDDQQFRRDMRRTTVREGSVELEAIL